MKLKLDDNGNAVLKDGHPVYVYDDGREAAIDVADMANRFTTLQADSKKAFTARDEAKAALKAFEGIDPEQARDALDENTTAGCALRHGLLYTLDTLEPIRHSVPIERKPPRHYRCRSILLPMAYADDIPMPEDGGQSTFREYFDSLTPVEQDRLFGEGRADLFRRGVITQSDLVGQNGQVLSLRDLAADLPEVEKVRMWAGRENYTRLVGELTPDMRAAGAAHGLTEAQMVALRHYTGSGFEALNEALRDGRTGRATVAAGVLNDALDRLPVHQGTVVRRVALDEDALAKHVRGAVVEYPAFTSATRGDKDVFDHRPHRLVIHGRTGRDIAQWSQYSRSELEVLFGVPRRFYVKSRTDMGGYIEIELEELP